VSYGIYPIFLQIHYQASAFYSKGSSKNGLCLRDKMVRPDTSIDLVQKNLNRPKDYLFVFPIDPIKASAIKKKNIKVEGIENNITNYWH
jgi:hypothetical protein